MKEAGDTSELLNISGLKATAQRIAVLDAMRLLGHASADDIKQTLESSGKSGISVATIYNVLGDLKQAGLLCKRMSANNKMYYDITVSDHCHIYDEASHTITDFNDTELMSLVSGYLKNKKIAYFDLDHVEIQIVGKFQKTK